MRNLLRRPFKPIRQTARRLLALPTLAEQRYLGCHGSLYSAAAFSARNTIAGDYLEFGVWNGDSFTHAYDAILTSRREHKEWLEQRRKRERVSEISSAPFELWRDWPVRLFAFDSFQGLPESLEEETSEDWCRGGYNCSEADFKHKLMQSGVDLGDVTTVPGFYNTSLTPALKKRLNLTRAAIVHIDCDYYESTILALDFATDLLVQGSILVFDDWFRCQGSPHRGEQRACREWLERNPQIELVEFWREPPQPVSFIVNFEKSPNSFETVQSAAGPDSSRGNCRPSGPIAR